MPVRGMPSAFSPSERRALGLRRVSKDSDDPGVACSEADWAPRVFAKRTKCWLETNLVGLCRVDVEDRTRAHQNKAGRTKSYRQIAVFMRTTQQFSFTLPNDMADVDKAKVTNGEYATGSEVIRDGQRALMVRDRAVEEWLHQQVGPALDALKADPSRAVSAQRVRERLAAARSKN